MFFQRDWGGSSKYLPTTRKCNRPPHLVINDSSLNAEIHILTHCLYNDKLMLIFLNIKIPRQNTCLHTICKAQIKVNIPKYTYADVNATIRMFI